MKRVVTWIRENVTDNDLYARQITFSLQGNDSFKTFAGGLLSFMIVLGMTVITIMLSVVLFKHGDTNKSTKNVIKDSFDNTDHHYIAREGDFAVAKGYISYPSGEIGTNLLADETYFTVRFDNIEYTRSNGEYSINSRIVEMDYCNDTFPFSGDEIYQRKGMDSYLCPQNNDYYLQGDFNSEVFSDVEILIYKCVNSTENNNHCKSDAEITNKVSTGYLDIAIVNSYFDFDDYQNPIKRYVGATELMFMSESFTQHFEGLIQRNTVLDSDNLFYKGSFK